MNTPSVSRQRLGIASGGNWIVDHLKTVDKLPARGMLANIQGKTSSTGGAPANVLGCLAALNCPFPLSGVGIVGDDEDGKFIIDSFSKLGVDVQHISVTGETSTSFTDVMSEEKTGDRIFYHARGANALFGPENIPVRKLDCSIFHLGYLLLLDSMDSPDSEFGIKAARALHELQEAGIKTSVDVVSEESDRFRNIVPPALKYVDYLILNEIETARTVGISVRSSSNELDGAALQKAVEKLYEFGNMELIAVHMPEGVFIMDRSGSMYSCGSLRLPDGYIAGATGAGDAFCAGMLYGLHEGWDYVRSARFGSCCAAASLSVTSATGGIKSMEQVLSLGKQYPEREPPVVI